MRLHRIRVLIAGCIAATGLSLVQSATVEHVQETIEQWVDTTQVIEETRREWVEQQRLLVHEAKLLKLELEELEERHSQLQKVNAKSNEDSVSANSDKARYSSLLDLFEESARGLESRLMRLYPAFPQPLKDQLAVVVPSREKLASLNVSERLRYLITILSEADKFNRDLTFVHEARMVEGKELQMKVLYWGLAAAYAIDWEGGVAQIGRPSADGWIWEDRSEFSEQIQKLIEVQQASTDAAFVTVPVVATEVKLDD